MKKTTKKEDTPTPKATTPIHASIARAMTTRQSRTNKTPTAEEKKQEREDRRTQDAVVRGRKATPRKGKKDASEAHEEKPEGGGDKHVTFQDEVTEITEEGSEAVIIERLDSMEDEHEEAENLKDHQPMEIEKDLEETKDKGDLQELAKDIESKGKEVKENAPKEEARYESTSVTTPIVVQDDKVDAEAKKREQAIIERYNQQWVEENTRRARVTEQEQQRRKRATKRIESEFERAMADEYTLRREADRSHKPSRRSTGAPVIPLYAATVIKEEKEDEEEVDEYSRTGDLDENLKRLEAGLVKTLKELEEKDNLIRQLQQSLQESAGRDKQLGEVLTQLEDQRKRNEIAETRTESSSDLDTELQKLNGEIDRLKALLLGKDTALAATVKNVEERQELVDYVSAALESEIEAVEDRKKQLREAEEQFKVDKLEFEARLQEQEGRVAELEAILAAKNKDFDDKVAKGVRAEIKRIKDSSRLRRATEASTPSASTSAATPSTSSSTAPTPQAPAAPLMTPFTGVPVSTYAINPPFSFAPPSSFPPPPPPLTPLPPLVDDAPADNISDQQNQDAEQTSSEDTADEHTTAVGDDGDFVENPQVRKRKRAHGDVDGGAEELYDNEDAELDEGEQSEYTVEEVAEPEEGFAEPAPDDAQIGDQDAETEAKPEAKPIARRIWRPLANVMAAGAAAAFFGAIHCMFNKHPQN